ncbi:TetR/AcrR family transcriptional regulator [Saccharopolyspora sp. K220]|uniref:TetR/AcrR family transcriptional regulator n=1 Tax=Saccharopolyspora soli TaxID=2926618 RepID=UPI001F58B55A|nr:TetR/AcrR family transcriptional regulator [Saccharopolyspora soli]MCI2418111.1 TetR/AcrR family transcriptional regulator [Saccharopolyspora soli]
MVSTKRLSARPARESGSERRAELLAIAGELFASRGFLATTVRDIADAAGILSGSLYHHFDSKESMVDEILRDFLDTQRRTNERVLREASDPRAAIIELIRQSFAAMQHHQAAIAIFQNESKYLAQFERFGYLRQAANEFERTWTRVLQDGQRSGAFRADLNVKLAYRFIRDMVWTTVHWYNPRGKLTSNVIADQYIKILCDGIVVP